MRLSELSKEFLFAMVQSMYAYEAKLVHEDRLLWDSEMVEFYITYMGGAYVQR